MHWKHHRIHHTVEVYRKENIFLGFRLHILKHENNSKSNGGPGMVHKTPIAEATPIKIP